MVGKWLVIVAWDPKSTDKEFATAAVVYNLVCIAQVNEETRSFVGFLEIK